LYLEIKKLLYKLIINNFEVAKKLLISTSVILPSHGKRCVSSFFGKYPSPLMTKDPGPPRMDSWIGSSSPQPIGSVIWTGLCASHIKLLKAKMRFPL